MYCLGDWIDSCTTIIFLLQFSILIFQNMEVYYSKLIPSHHPNLWSEGHRFRLRVRRTRLFSEFIRVIFVCTCNRKVTGSNPSFRGLGCFPSFVLLSTEVETIWSSCRWMLERGHISTLRLKVPWRTRWSISGKWSGSRMSKSLLLLQTTRYL